MSQSHSLLETFELFWFLKMETACCFLKISKTLKVWEAFNIIITKIIWRLLLIEARKDSYVFYRSKMAQMGILVSLCVSEEWRHNIMSQLLCTYVDALQLFADSNLSPKKTFFKSCVALGPFENWTEHRRYS